MPISGSNRWGLTTMSNNNKTEKTLKAARDFQPDAIMLETHAPSVPLHIVWYLAILILIAFIIWSCYARVDKVVVAHGKVVTERPALVMKPLERTTIQKVHVRTGDKVKKGDLLFSFDQTTNQAELERLKEQLAALNAEALRLNAEAAGYDKKFVLPKDATNFDKLQLSTYEARKNYYNKKLLSYDVSMTRYEMTLAQLQKSMDKYEERNHKLDQIEEMMRDLEDNRAVSLRDFLNVQVQALETEISIDQQQVSIVENEQTIKTVKAEREAFISDWNREIFEKLVEVDRNISSLSQQIIQTNVLVRFTELRAPCDAVVHEIAPYQEGSAIREAESLITLIPLDVKLVAEVNIPAKDISRVSIGNKCRLKLDTFPFQQCGTLSGEIIFISEDAFTGKSGQPTEDEMSSDAGGRLSKNAIGTTYQAHISLEGELHGRAKGVKIMPGMTLSAEIKVGDRTVINYMLNPLVKAMDESIREP